ncbi:MAG TPA: DUF2259 domain-containing protein [Myxococcales bacterium]|nr:DUF2259 domain-containing protein [Myxococcales bacterium]
MLVALLAGLQILGFSPDDRYVAYVEHGVGEGSGNAWATLHVLDVKKGAPARPPVEIRLDTGDEEAAVAKAREAGEAARGKLQIDAWASPKEVAHDERGAMTEESGAPIGTIELKTKSAGPKERAKCEEPFQPLLLSLKVIWMDDDRPSRIADEKKPPASRPCASGCALDKVWAHGKAALVSVKCTVQGFEGPVPKYSYYTSLLPYGLAE